MKATAPARRRVKFWDVIEVRRLSFGAEGNNHHSPFVPDHLAGTLPGEIGDPRRGKLWTKEQALLAAVLLEAADCVRLRLSQRDKARDHQDIDRTPSVRERAIHWFCSEDRSALFTFRMVCFHLNLNPDAVRRAVLGPHVCNES